MILYRILIPYQIDIWDIIKWSVVNFGDTLVGEWGYRVTRIEKLVVYEFLFKKLSDAMQFNLIWKEI